MFSIVGPLTIIGGLLLAVGSAKQRLTTLEEWKRKTEDRISALEKWSWKTKGRDMVGHHVAETPAQLAAQC